MRQYLLFSLFILISLSVMADSYRQIELKHRSAVSLQSRLSPLLGNDVAVVSEGNSLILRGPSAELNQLMSVIKKLDTPRQQLYVSIYRGVDPEVSHGSHGVKTWSTDRRIINRLDEAIVEEEATLVITDSELIFIPQEVYQEHYQSKHPNVNIVDSENFKQQVNGQYQARYQNNKIVTQENTISLTPSLLAEGNIALIVNYSIPLSPTQSSSRQVGSPTTALAFKDVSTTRNAKINQWLNLSSHHQQTYRPSLNSKKKVVSTKSKDDEKHSVWVKFSLVK